LYLESRLARESLPKSAKSDPMRKTPALALLLAFAACGGTVRELSEHKVGQVPALGSTQTAVVGDVLYSEFEYTGNSGAITSGAFEQRVGLGSVRVPSNTTMVSSDIDGRKGYCSSTLTYYDPLVGPYTGTCWFDANNDSRFEEFWINPGGIPYTYDADTPLVYKISEISNAAGGFKYEIVYQGLDGAVLRMLYREYVDNMVRPAFQQDLTYNLNPSGPTLVRFRSVSIEVVAAGGSEITYVVRSGFEG
jgi:hypothetical protein